VLYIFADYANSKSVVHRFIKEVAIELDNIRVVLSFEQLNGFFLTENFSGALNLLCIRLACLESWPLLL